MWIRAVALLMASACLVAASPGAAQARELGLHDRRGDVWRSGGDGSWKPSGSHLGDVARAHVAYAGRRVVVRIKLTALRRTGSYAQYDVRIQGRGDRRVRELVVEASPRAWGGELHVFRRGGTLDRRCDASHRIDYRRDRVVVRMRRYCLDWPRSVRVNVNAFRANRRGVFFADNPHDSRAESSAWSDWVRRTR